MWFCVCVCVNSVYHYYGERSVIDSERDADDKEGAQEDALTCGINTNMCAALLHVLSDLARSTTTFVEGIIIIFVPSIPSTKADGVSTLIVCSIIAIGAFGALVTWMREVYIYISQPPLVSLNPDYSDYDYGYDELAKEDTVNEPMHRPANGV